MKFKDSCGKSGEGQYVPSTISTADDINVKLWISNVSML